MRRGSPRPASRAFALARTGYGTMLLAAPGAVARWYTGLPAEQATVAVALVLGTRQLAQAAATSARPGRAGLGVGVAVDVMHAASMVGLAALSRRWRRGGLVDAAVASSFAVAGLRLARRPRA